MAGRIVILATVVIATLMLSGCRAIQVTVPSQLPKDVPPFFRPVIQDAGRAGISVLLPTRLPDLPSTGWTWSLDDYKVDGKKFLERDGAQAGDDMDSYD